MEKYISSLIIILLHFTLQAQDNMQDNNDFLIGKVDRKELQTGEFGNYFLPEYRQYNPDKEILGKLEGIFNYDITIVLATWCPDSQREVPRFFKILDMLKYNTGNVEIYCVDRDKKAGDYDISSLEIERVPTFIFFRQDGEEAGRIVETPHNSLEKDIFDIISK